MLNLLADEAQQQFHVEQRKGLTDMFDCKRTVGDRLAERRLLTFAGIDVLDDFNDERLLVELQCHEQGEIRIVLIVKCLPDAQWRNRFAQIDGIEHGRVVDGIDQKTLR